MEDPPDFVTDILELCHISQKHSRVSQLPAKSPGSQMNFVSLPKQALLEIPPSAALQTAKEHSQKRLSRAMMTLTPPVHHPREHKVLL